MEKHQNFIDSGNDQDYRRFRTEPDGKSCLAMKGNSCPWHRGKVIGGSSTITGMLYVRGSREDFDEWARLGNPGLVLLNGVVMSLTDLGRR